MWFSAPEMRNASIWWIIIKVVLQCLQNQKVHGFLKQPWWFSGGLCQIDYSWNTDLSPDDLHQDWGYLIGSQILSLHPPPSHSLQLTITVSLNFLSFFFFSQGQTCLFFIQSPKSRQCYPGVGEKQKVNKRQQLGSLKHSIQLTVLPAFLLSTCVLKPDGLAFQNVTFSVMSGCTH